MEQDKIFCGVVIPLVTPFKSNDDVDIDGLKTNVRKLIEKGLVTGRGAIAPAGSTGEGWLLTVEETKKVNAACIEAADGKVPVVCGCVHASTRIGIELCLAAQKDGADGLMVLPPHYGKPDERLVLKHYQMINDAVDIGIMVYNNPIVTGLDISVECLEDLAALDNVVALKDISQDLIKIEKLMRELQDSLIFINGSSEYYEPQGYIYGGNGFISTIANFVPEYPLRMQEAASRKDWDRVTEIRHQISPLLDFIRGLGPEYPAGRNAAMDKNGFVGGKPRDPYIPISQEHASEMAKILNSLG